METPEKQYLIDEGFDINSQFDADVVEILLKDYAKKCHEIELKNHSDLSNVIVFSEKKMWDIDGKLVVGSPVTDEEIEYYNRFFGQMVSEMQDDSDHWTHHASKVSNKR